MRKRVIIGLLAMVIIGMVVFFVSEAKQGSVEYHKAQAQKALGELSGQRSSWKRLTTELRMVRGLPPANDAFDRFEKHSKALVDLGYLDRREFHLTNSPADPAGSLFRLAAKESAQDDLWNIQTLSNNVLVVWAKRHSMKRWEEALRKIDVPEVPE